MESVHGRDQITNGACSSGPGCFGQKVSNAEGALYQFTAASIGAGLIDGYTQAFANNTTIAEAEQQVMKWMPSDATMGALTIDHHGGSCAWATITSPKLARLFKNPQIGDPSGRVWVEFGYIDAALNQVYQPNNVQHADISTIPASSSQSC